MDPLRPLEADLVQGGLKAISLGEMVERTYGNCNDVKNETVIHVYTTGIELERYNRSGFIRLFAFSSKPEQ